MTAACLVAAELGLDWQAAVAGGVDPVTVLRRDVARAAPPAERPEAAAM